MAQKSTRADLPQMSPSLRILFILLMETPAAKVPVPPPTQKKGILGSLQSMLSIFKRRPKGKEMDVYCFIVIV